MAADEKTEPDVIPVDFGKEQRESARRLLRLLGVLEAQRHELLTDPVRLFNLASERIHHLSRALRDAQNDLRGLATWVVDKSLIEESAHIDTIRIPKDEYDRLKACEATVIKACNKFSI